MGIGSLAIRLPQQSRPAGRQTYSIVIDSKEFLTSSSLLDDIDHLLARYEDMAVPGARFDLLFTSAGPYSASIHNRGGALLLRISDSFDGGVLEEIVDFIVLRQALAGLIGEFLGMRWLDAAVTARLTEALGRFSAWPGPVLRR